MSDAVRTAILSLNDFEPEKPKLEDILKAVSEICRVPVPYMLGPMRWPDYCRARHIFVYVARTLTAEKFQVLSLTLKRMDHSTAINSFRIVEKNPQQFEPELSRVMHRVVPKELRIAA